MKEIFTSEILGKHAATYFQCPECGLIQPKDPTWLAEAYESAIAASDVGLVGRNIYNMRRLESVLHRLHTEGAAMLDVGGGYGLLCRCLRDIGFHCNTTDIYCENIFAKGFEPEPGAEYETLFAFEVFEHISDALTFTRSVFDKYNAKRLIFSTLTHTGSEPPPKDWSYYAFETGQHISLYHDRSISVLAEKLGLHRLTVYSDLHILSKEPFTLLDRLLLTPGVLRLRKLHGILVSCLRRGISLTQDDYGKAKQSLHDRAADQRASGTDMTA